MWKWVNNSGCYRSWPPGSTPPPVWSDVKLERWDVPAEACQGWTGLRCLHQKRGAAARRGIGHFWSQTCLASFIVPLRMSQATTGLSLSHFCSKVLGEGGPGNMWEQSYILDSYQKKNNFNHGCPMLWESPRAVLYHTFFFFFHRWGVGGGSFRVVRDILGTWNRSWNVLAWNFPGGVVVRASPSSTGGASLIPDPGDLDHTCLAAKEPEHKAEAIL